MRQHKTETIPLDKITVENRARKDMGDIEDLALSIKDKGLLQNLVVDQNYRLLAGGRRHAALILLKAKEVTVTVIQTTDEIDPFEIELIENLVRKDMEWPEWVELVQKMHDYYSQRDKNWTQSKTAGILERSVGSINQILQLAEGMKSLPGLSDEKTEADAFRKMNTIMAKLTMSELKTRLEKRSDDDDIQVILTDVKKNYLIGDAIEEMRKLPSNDASIIFAEIDPPYGIALNEVKRQDDTGEIMDGYVEVDVTKYEDFLIDLTKEIYRVLPPSATFVFWFAFDWYEEVYQALTEAGFLIDPIPAIWIKKHGQTNREKTNLARAYETFFYGRKPGSNTGLSKKGRINIFDFQTVPGAFKRHPTQKPLAIMQEIIETFCLDITPDRKILVPFMGSGVTYLAARALGLTAFGWDLNSEYRDKLLLSIQGEDIKSKQMEE